jgi:hypothetical protein
MGSVLPSTQARVRKHSSDELNSRMREDALSRLKEYEGADSASIAARIAELEREWDIERVLEANAATVALIGLGLGASVDRRWFALPAVVAAFLLQHALQGWCPPLPVFRRLGVRTAQEIHEEILALKLMRGDFEGSNTHADEVAQKARIN